MLPLLPGMLTCLEFVKIVDTFLINLLKIKWFNWRLSPCKMHNATGYRNVTTPPLRPSVWAYLTVWIQAQPDLHRQPGHKLPGTRQKGFSFWWSGWRDRCSYKHRWRGQQLVQWTLLPQQLGLGGGRRGASFFLLTTASRPKWQLDIYR